MSEIKRTDKGLVLKVKLDEEQIEELQEMIKQAKISVLDSLCYGCPRKGEVEIWVKSDTQE